MGVRIPPGLCSVILFVETRMILKVKEFLSDVVIEVKKVTWPSRKEAISGTMVVLVVVFIMAVYLGIVDVILSKLVESLIRAN